LFEKTFGFTISTSSWNVFGSGPLLRDTSGGSKIAALTLSLFDSVRPSRRYGLALPLGICIAALSYTQTQYGQSSAGGAAAKRTATPQQIQAGQKLFSARCGVCHGQDARGGRSGPNLISSALVAQDAQGDKIGPVVRNGRPDKGMPPFDLDDEELAAVVAFIHDPDAKGTEGRQSAVAARGSRDGIPDRDSAGQSRSQQGETRHDSARPVPTEKTGNEQSHAANVAPPSANLPWYSSEQLQAGQTLFAAQCGFCHGRDAGGGEGGPDLIASPLVAQDERGEKIVPVIRNGRPEKGMPAFDHADEQLAAIVAFIHDRKAKAKEGRRRSVDIADLQTGNAEEGMRYFHGAGGCAKCHSPSGDLAGVAGKLQGLELLRRMLYPGGGRTPGSAEAVDTATVTLPSGQTVTGKLAYRDEFTIGLTDPSGWYRSWPANQVKFTVMNPLEAHIEQLRKYTDEDIHNVLAYLQTLR
jgi:cytochrome c oxidase cbb3-type subunit 3